MRVHCCASVCGVPWCVCVCVCVCGHDQRRAHLLLPRPNTAASRLTPLRGFRLAGGESAPALSLAVDASASSGVGVLHTDDWDLCVVGMTVPVAIVANIASSRPGGFCFMHTPSPPARSEPVASAASDSHSTAARGALVLVVSEGRRLADARLTESGQRASRTRS